jgi:hypothetical protein
VFAKLTAQWRGQAPVCRLRGGEAKAIAVPHGPSQTSPILVKQLLIPLHSGRKAAEIIATFMQHTGACTLHLISFNDNLITFWRFSFKKPPKQSEKSAKCIKMVQRTKMGLNFAI